MIFEGGAKGRERAERSPCVEHSRQLEPVNYARNRWPLFSTRLVGPRRLPTVRKNRGETKFPVDFLLASSFSIRRLPHPRPPFPSLPSSPFYFLGDGRVRGKPRDPSYHPPSLFSPVFPLFDFTSMGCRERKRERREEKRKVPGRKKGFNYSARRNVLTRCTGNRLSSIYLPTINIKYYFELSACVPISFIGFVVLRLSLFSTRDDYLLQLTQNDLTHELTYKTFFLYFDISLRESYTLKKNLSTIFPLASSSPT